MTHPRDGDSAERSPAEPEPAGPVADDGGALRAGSSSTPPSSAPPAGEPSGEPPARSQGQGAEESATEQVEEDLDALLADTQRERDEYLELARRTKADFENYRKRVAAEVQAASARGKGELVRELIDPVDNLERALVAAGIDPEDPPGDVAAAEPAEVRGPEGLAHGVSLVLAGLKQTLARHGIEALDPKGEKFDPRWHEALSTQPADGAEPGTVLEVVQKGYRFGDQLIRPARVVVGE